MGSRPLNLAFRFQLKIAASVAIGYWGFSEHTGIGRFLLGIGLPVIAAAIWGSFAVPDDPIRSGPGRRQYRCPACCASCSSCPCLALRPGRSTMPVARCRL